MSDEYLPIALKTLRVNTVLGCDLYLENRTESDIRYVLYCSGASVIKPDTIEELLMHKVERLFIRKEDQGKYLQYVESVLGHIINGNIDMKIKSQMVYEIAKNIMIDVLDDPRSGKNVERSKDWVSNAVEFIMKNADASSNMIRVISYDYYTYTHSVNVSVLGLLFSRYIGLGDTEMRSLGTGLLLHDIGKTQIGAEIVNKNGRLSDEEFAEIKKHVELGAHILEQTGGIEDASFFAVMQHHEKCNGMGYPKGLKGNNIHKYGKIAKVVDVYDALTTRRSYSDARKPFFALKIMKDEMEGSFDWGIFKSFVLFLRSAV